MRNHNGFTMIELLICLFLSTLLSPIAIRLLRFQLEFPDHNTIRQNQLGILQFRRYLSLGRDHKIEEDRVCMNYHDEDFCFYQHETNLIGTPGTQFFLIDVENISFVVEGHWLVLSFNSSLREHRYHILYNAKF